MPLPRSVLRGPSMAAADLDVKHWDTADAADLYEVARWGNGYFSVGPTGHLLVHPDKNPTKSIDLKQLVDSPRSLSTAWGRSTGCSRRP